MNFFLSLLFVVCVSDLYAQNLVPNGDFESYKHCPNNYIYSDPIHNHLSEDTSWKEGPTSWNPASFGHPVYFNKCSNKFTSDLQIPRSGNAYVGINAYSPHSFFKAYISAILDTSLKKDELYCVSFYVSLDKNSRYITAFLGLYLSQKPPGSFNMSPQPYIPQITNTIPFISNDSGWTEISSIYKAKGGEKYVILGDFYPKDDGGKLRKPNQGIKSYNHELAYYLIDDVSITHIKNEFGCNQVGKTFILKNVSFKTNKSELLPESFYELGKLVDFMKSNTKSLEISGHTDNVGEEAANIKLATARAKAVADYLVLKGIKRERLKYIGFGSLKPIADNKSEAGKKQNRRVELMFSK